MPETICAAMRVVSPYGRPSGVKPICAMSIESCVNSAAPTQIRMFVRSPAGLSGELALDADRAAEQRGEQQLAEHAEPKRLGERGDRLAQIAATERVDDDRQLPPVDAARADRYVSACRDRERRQASCPATNRRS